MISARRASGRRIRELLDWLAVEFMDSGWDVKGMLKTMVMSATYRQSSKARPELLERDPDNRLLARGARFRLPAETIRDQALAASGLLNDGDGRAAGEALPARRACGAKLSGGEYEPDRATLSTAAASTPTGGARSRRRR